VLPQVRLLSAGHGIDARFARALPAARGFDLARPHEALQACMRFADHAFLLDIADDNPLAWRYAAQAGQERLRGAAGTRMTCLGELPDPPFTSGVLIPTYWDVIAADQPVVHQVAAVPNGTFLAYRKLTVPFRASPRAPRASHILTLTFLDFAVPGIAAQAERMRRLSPRERQCLSLAAGGLIGKQIAAELGVSAKMVELHLAGIRRKLGARTTAQAVANAITVAMTQG
jgi:DNA-binding CsgD family transcriptional regulator